MSDHPVFGNAAGPSRPARPEQDRSSETWIRYWARGSLRDTAMEVHVDIERTANGGWRATLPLYLYSDSEPAELYEVELLGPNEKAVVARSTATINMVIGRRTLVLRGQNPFEPA